MSFTNIFVSRWPERHILTRQPLWSGEGDVIDFDAELHKETAPAHLLQLTDQVSVWQSQFMWQGAYAHEDFGEAEDEILRRGWRERHGSSYPFWIPSWKSDFVLANNINDGATTITVVGQNFLPSYQRDCEGRKGRKWYITELGESRWRWSLYGLLLIHDSRPANHTYKGLWSAGPRYEPGDVVKNGSQLYYCILTHTASSTNEPGSGASWTTYWDKFSYEDQEEVRRFLPIGDPAIADDELTEGNNQGAGALSANGSNTDIKLRLMAGEELPAIRTEQIKLLSLVRHVRFSSKVQCSYAADYVPRISVGVQQVFDEAIFAPDIVAAFDYYIPDNPEGTAIYRQGRRVEGDANKDFTVSLSSPAPVDGVEVHYDLSGDAEDGVHYQILAGVSPLVFNKGETQKTITLRTPKGTTYFLERLLKFTINKGDSSSLITTEEDSDEFRMYIACDIGDNPPPVINWTTAGSSWGNPGNGGTHSGAVASVLSSQTQEDTPIWYEVDPSSTAVEGVDYELPLRSSERVIGSSGGTNSASLPVTVLAGHTPGRTLKLNLRYERSTGEDQNNATYTETWRAEHKNDGPAGLWPEFGVGEVRHVNYWPCGDNDGLWTFGPASSIVTGRPWSPVEIIDPEKKHPGDPLGAKPLEGFKHRPGATQNGYVRHSSADEFNCDGNIETFELIAWQRWDVRVEVPSPSICPDGLPRYMRLSLRDRGWVGEGGTDISHIVVFDSQSTNGGLLGAPVVTATGSWGVERARHEAGNNAASDWASGQSYVVGDIVVNNDDAMYQCKLNHTSSASNEPGRGGSWTTYWNVLSKLYYGVEEDNGETVIWMAYNEGDPERITGAGHAGPSRNNRLFYHNNFSAYPSEGGVQENLGKGVLYYKQVHKRSNSSLLGPLLEYWPRPRSRWEPRGNAFRGTTLQHTITL